MVLVSKNLEEVRLFTLVQANTAMHQGKLTPRRSLLDLENLFILDSFRTYKGLKKKL